MVAVSGRRVVSATLYRKRPASLFLFRPQNILLIVFYAYVLNWCIMTIGEQYEEALERAEREDLELPNSLDALRSAATVFLSGVEDEKERAKAMPKQVRLPSKYLPGFWPLLLLGTLVCLNILYFLVQYWVIEFRCFVQFHEVGHPDNATHVKIVPYPHLGKKGLVPIIRTSLGATFEYNRRKYAWDEAKQQFVKIRCPVTMSLAHFATWRGFPHDDYVSHAHDRYGANKFEVHSPTFLELYKGQLISPLTVFQLFCVILWMLDDYWQYSAFTFVMILGFEATVVTSRLKSISNLRGMKNKSLSVKVLRSGKWVDVETEQLYPGDIFSLTPSKESDIIPCDCILLKGMAVVNEATLTGESIPQMKEALSEITFDELNIKSAHKVHVLFSGTRLLQANLISEAKVEESKDDEAENEIEVSENEDEELDELGEEEQVLSLKELQQEFKQLPVASDKGCVCYVLRTGFSSAQGKLVRMIECSTENVRSNVRDTVLLLLLLLLFAIIASGYVLKRGMEDKNRSQFELLLHCILIVTSVIPPELPMQTALAVNSSLMALMKMQVFCTEPFRVPLAGKTDTCLFDKTGTLTTDELVAVGVLPASVCMDTFDNNNKDIIQQLVNMDQSPAEAILVLGGCHALISVDGELAGDPLEAASIKSIKWEPMKNKLHYFRPKNGKDFKVDKGDLASSIQITSRHHFSSKLQRMSVVARGVRRSGATNLKTPLAWVLMKGSPEAIRAHLAPGSVPPKYDFTASQLAKKGMRVIALAYKRLNSEEEITECENSRSSAESNLEFAGFVAFTCRVRKDTAEVIAKLKAGAHAIIMVTGDALLTAIHVAKEVGIITKEKSNTIFLDEESNNDELIWRSYETNQKISNFVVADIPNIAKNNYLCITGHVLGVGLRNFPELRDHLEHFCVFSRMRPDEKENLIVSLKERGKHCMMCGDGANDVGALKQADVGVALLSGFGDINVNRGDDTSKTEATQSPGTAIMTQDEFQELQKLKVQDLKQKLREIGIDPSQHPSCVEKNDLIQLYRVQRQKQAVVVHDSKKKPLTPEERRLKFQQERNQKLKEQQELFQRNYAERQARGESFAFFKAMKASMSQQMEEAKKIKEKRVEENSVTGSAARMAAMMEGLEESEIPVIKVGDASVAAPFTSKIPSIKSTVDIIRQGRCTLVTSIQMFQILALNCLISAYSLSVLYLDGIKYGDIQMTAMGILMTISFLTLSRSQPLSDLSPVRPLLSIFHPALFISLLGQFAMHLFSMIFVVGQAKKYLGPQYKPILDGEFQPNLVNSVVFLASSIQHVSVFVVNLKGPPFMTGIGQNRPLLYSLAVTFMLTFMCASEFLPQMNKLLQLTPFPDTQFRNRILLALGADIFIAFGWDRLMLAIFAPQVFRASVQGINMGEVFKFLRILFFIGLIIYFFGNINEEELNAIMLELNSTQTEESVKAFES